MVTGLQAYFYVIPGFQVFIKNAYSREWLYLHSLGIIRVCTILVSIGKNLWPLKWTQSHTKPLDNPDADLISYYLTQCTYFISKRYNIFQKFCPNRDVLLIVQPLYSRPINPNCVTIALGFSQKKLFPVINRLLGDQQVFIFSSAKDSFSKLITTFTKYSIQQKILQIRKEY